MRLHGGSNCNCKCTSQPIRQASTVAPLTFPRGQRFTSPVLKARRSHSAANKWLRECIITAFWFSCSHAPGTVVTARWESSHVLIPAGFLSSNWLDRLLSISSDFFVFFSPRTETKRRSGPTVMVRDVTHPSASTLHSRCTCASACAPETRYGTRRQWKNTQQTITWGGSAGGS